MRLGKCPKDKTDLRVSMRLWNSIEEVYCPKCGSVYNWYEEICAEAEMNILEEIVCLAVVAFTIGLATGYFLCHSGLNVVCVAAGSWITFLAMKVFRVFRW